MSILLSTAPGNIGGHPHGNPNTQEKSQGPSLVLRRGTGPFGIYGVPSPMGNQHPPEDHRCRSAPGGFLVSHGELDLLRPQGTH